MGVISEYLWQFVIIICVMLAIAIGLRYRQKNNNKDGAKNNRAQTLMYDYQRLN
jgi:uncharacterized membrane protein